MKEFPWSWEESEDDFNMRTECHLTPSPWGTTPYSAGPSTIIHKERNSEKKITPYYIEHQRETMEQVENGTSHDYYWR